MMFNGMLSLKLMKSADDLHFMPLRSYKYYLANRFNLPLNNDSLVNMPLWYSGVNVYIDLILAYRVG